MKELALHILDLVQNSLVAGASLIKICIKESKQNNLLQIEIIDNGCGIAADKLQEVLDPFYTTRTTRKVGLGIPLFQAAALQSEGDFKIESDPGRGTTISAEFKYDNIDRPPLGNIVDSLVTLIICNPEINFYFEYQSDHNEFCFDTREAKQYLSSAELGTPLVANHLRDYLTQKVQAVTG